MGAVKDILNFCARLRDAESRTGEKAPVKIEAAVSKEQSNQVMRDMSHSELLEEIIRLKNELMDLKNFQAQEMTAIQEMYQVEISKSTVSNQKPTVALDPKTQEILMFIFQKSGEVTEQEIAQYFQMELSAVSLHTYMLWKTKYIGSADPNVVGFNGGWANDAEGGDNSARYRITDEGRYFINGRV